MEKMMSYQPGKYWIGDLCYVMHDEWTEVCDLTISARATGGGDCLEGDFKLGDGRQFTLFRTAYGDGEYLDDQNHNSYCVDSGTIGIILLSDIKEKLNEVDNLGHIHEFETSFSCYSDGRVLKFGHVSIDTDPPYEEDDDDYQSYQDEEEE
jgi:hypothetical protein